MAHPIGFSIPECKVIKALTNKTQFMGTVIPGISSTYIFNNEKDYYEDYQKSLFGQTCLKAGWDCLRHYEILANGCIPWFKNLDQCPPNTMTHLPKELIMNAMKELSIYKDIPINEWNMDHSNKLLEYTKEHLTTKKMASYILKTSNNENAKSILYLSQDIRPDYLRCLTLHGFKDLLGNACHDSPCIPHIYTDYSAIESQKLYGKGITYSRIIDKNIYRDNTKDTTLIDDIKSHKYDVIVYGSVHRGLPYWDIVNYYYYPDKIILLCGEDLHGKCEFEKYAEKGYHVFIREL